MGDTLRATRLPSRADHVENAAGGLAPACSRERQHLVRLCLGGVFLLALVVRVGHLVAYGDSPFARYPLLDEAYYDAWARQVAGGTFLSEGILLGMPAYPLLLGGVYALAGGSMTVALAGQALLGALTASLVALLGIRLVSLRAGIVAGVLTALYGPLVFLGGRLLSENLALPVNALMLLYALEAFEGRSARRFGVLGLLVGLAVLVRVQALIFAALTLAFLLLRWRREAWKSALLFLGGLGLLLAPLLVRNLIVLGEPILLSANGGVNFTIGNHEKANGYFAPPAFFSRRDRQELYEDSKLLAEQRTGRAMSNREVDSYWYGEGLRYAREHPARWLGLAARKFAHFWNAREVPDILDYYSERRYSAWLSSPVDFRLLGLLAAVGLGTLWPLRRRALPVYLYLGAQVLFVVIFFFHARFRLMALPALAVLAGQAVEWAVGATVNRRVRSLGVAAAGAVAAAFLVFAPSGIDGRSLEAGNLYNTALALASRGESSGLESMFRQVLALDPGYAQAHFELGKIYQERGSYDRALQEFQAAVAAQPRLAGAYGNMGVIYYRQFRDLQAAEQAFRAAIDADPRLVAAYRDLARVLFAQGKPEQAAQVLARAAALPPRHPPSPALRPGTPD